VDLVEPERDHVRSNRVEDREDVPLVPEHGEVDRLQGRDQLDARRLRRDRLVLEPLRRRVSGHDDDKLVAEPQHSVQALLADPLLNLRRGQVKPFVR